MRNGLICECLRETGCDVCSALPDSLRLRIRRATSWIDRAEKETDDHDAAFIFYWIGFNSAYQDQRDSFQEKERDLFRKYFDKIINLDTDHTIYDAIWQKFSGPIRILLDNKYVFQPFWDHYNDFPGYENWSYRFERQQNDVRKALGRGDTKSILNTLFYRLYTLRNQLLHGGATWNGSVNRQQVGDGARIMAFMVPLFVKLMMANPQIYWGIPRYPVVR